MISESLMKRMVYIAWLASPRPSIGDMHPTATEDDVWAEAGGLKDGQLQVGYIFGRRVNLLIRSDGLLNPERGTKEQQPWSRFLPTSKDLESYARLTLETRSDVRALFGAARGSALL